MLSDTHTFVPDSRQNTHTTHQGHKYIYVASVLFLEHRIWKDPVIAAPVTVLNRSLFNFIIDHCSVVSLHLKCCFTEMFVSYALHGCFRYLRTRFCPWWSAMARRNYYWLLTDHNSYLYNHYFRHSYTLVHYLE